MSAPGTALVAGVSRVARRATAVRGAAVLHPRGEVRHGRLVVAGSPGRPWGARLLDRPATHRVLVRVSRSAGLPRPLPDVDGLAVRLPRAGHGGGPLDLLLVRAWRFVFVPSPLGRTWSTIVPMRTGTGRLVLLGARPTARGFDLLAAGPLGPWRPWGELRLGRRADVDLRTRPDSGATDLHPVRWLRRLRARSYRASQSAR